MESFAGRIAVVTGGGTGMGRELVRQLAAEGCHVAFCDVNPETMAETRELAEKEAPAGTRPRLLPRYRNACARDLPALMIELSTAIEVGDVNQLAAFYRWTGMSTRAGYDIMDRLEKIAGRPLVDVVPVYAEPEPTPGSLYLPPLDEHHPVGVRIEQTLEDGMTPSSTTLRLEQEAGCWWVRL